MTRDEMRAYLAAFIDGEGHIGCHMTGRGRMSKTIEFTNTDKQLFDRVIAIGAELGLPFRIYFRKAAKPHWSDTWIAYLKGGKANMERFRELIPLQCEKKRAALEELVSSYRGPEELEKIYASRRTSIQLQCRHCGKDFWAFPADIKRGNGVYCSRACGAKGRSKKVEKTCQTCGQSYTVYRARAGKTKFCSMRCFGVSKGDRLRAQAQRASDTRWHPERLERMNLLSPDTPLGVEGGAGNSSP